nr:hypothetical protein [Aminipila luticellarii]
MTKKASIKTKLVLFFGLLILIMVFIQGVVSFVELTKAHNSAIAAEKQKFDVEIKPVLTTSKHGSASKMTRTSRTMVKPQLMIIPYRTPPKIRSGFFAPKFCPVNVMTARLKLIKGSIIKPSSLLNALHAAITSEPKLLI